MTDDVHRVLRQDDPAVPPLLADTTWLTAFGEVLIAYWDPLTVDPATPALEIARDPLVLEPTASAYDALARMRRGRVQLATVVEGVRLDLIPAIGQADAQLTVEVAPDLLVSFSPPNLRSIVYNLLSNALKYRAPDRPAHVQVRAAQTPQGVVLTVQDNGLGMTEGQQRQLFGLFQRLHTHVEGTGVGLYITKRLVENGGGTIAVQSQPNVGTTFTVTFPT